jgi:small subunit ribosomal protein S9
MAQKLKKKVKQKQVIVKRVKPEVDAHHAGKTLQHVPKSRYVEGIGRRKTAVARVRIYEEKGDFLVNDKPVGEYFKLVMNAPILYNAPLHVTETLNQWAITVQVKGSGINAQLDAVVHGLSRALLKKNNEQYRPLLKVKGFLTRDDRMKETRKIGMGGKARRQRQSPRR